MRVFTLIVSDVRAVMLAVGAVRSVILALGVDSMAVVKVPSTLTSSSNVASF